MQLHEVFIYLGTALTLAGRFPQWHAVLRLPGKNLTWVKWMFLLGAVALGLGSYFDNNPIFTGLEIVVAVASATAFISTKYLHDTLRAMLSIAGGIVALAFSIWMITQGAPWYWWNWFGVVGILFIIPAFSFVGNNRVSNFLFIFSSTLLALNALLFFQLGFSHISVNFLILNIIFGVESAHAFFSKR